MELDTIVVGDCLDVMAEMEDGCVDLVVTSPPYNLDVDYGSISDNRPDYIKWFTEVLNEIRRLLITSGRLCLNLPAHTSDTLGGFEVLEVPIVAKKMGIH